VCSEQHRLGYKVTINHRCPKLKLGIDTVHIKREWGAEFGWEKTDRRVHGGVVLDGCVLGAAQIRVQSNHKA